MLVDAQEAPPGLALNILELKELCEIIFSNLLPFPKSLLNIRATSKRQKTFIHDKGVWMRLRFMFYNDEGHQISNITLKAILCQHQLKEEIPRLSADLFSHRSSIQTRLRAASHFRDRAAQDLSFTDQIALKDSKIIPKIIDLLKSEESDELKGLALSSLANLTKKSHYHSIITAAGAVPILIDMLASPRRYFISSALFTIGNIALASSMNRSYIFSSNVISPVVKILSTSEDEELLEMAARVCRNLSDEFSSEDWSKLTPIIKQLPHLLRRSHKRIVSNAGRVFKACVKVANITKPQLKQMMDLDLTSLVIQLAADHVGWAFDAVDAIAVNYDFELDLVNHGVYPFVEKMFTSNVNAGRILSNVAICQQDCVKRMIELEILARVVKLPRDQDWAQREITYYFANAITSCRGSVDLLRHFVLPELGIVKLICTSLFEGSSKDKALQALESLLCIQDLSEQVVEQIRHCDGVARLLQLKNDKSKKAGELIDRYFKHDILQAPASEGKVRVM
jgi:HEAT repeat protein